MTKNSNKEIDESEDSSIESNNTIDYKVAHRPVKPSKIPRQVTTACEALVVLDVMKGGLVSVRGGHHQDQAFIILDSNHNTELLYSTVRKSIEMQLIQPGRCSRFYEELFYSPVRKAGKRYISSKSGVSDAQIEECNYEANENYANGRYIIRVTLPSSTSAIYFVHSYLELLLDSLPRISEVPGHWILAAYVKCSNWKVEDFVKYAKYCTAYPMAKFLKQQDLPELPSGLDSHRVFNGPIEKIIRARLVCSTDKKCARLFFGLLQGVKRACNVVPMTYIQASKAKHLKTLTTVPKDIDFEYLYGSFTSLAQRLFDGVSLRESDILRFTEPSKNSSYIYQRREGGQETDVRQALNIPYVKDDDDLHGTFYPEDEDPDDPNSDAFCKLIAQDKFSDLGLMAESEDLNVKELRGIVLTASDKRELVLRTCEDWKTRPMSCKIVPLSEPLKVRTISAGPGVPYYLAKPYQKCIWGWLKKMPQFTVIGEPLSAQHLENLLSRERQLDGLIDNWNRQKRSSDTGYPSAPSDFWVSGDYSAATDGLKIFYSLQTFDVITDRLLRSCRSERNQEYTFLKEYLSLMRKLMEGHRLSYVDNNGVLEKLCKELKIDFEKVLSPDMKVSIVVKQQNGQLMGSPISFPFLCAINFICYWTSMNSYLGRYIPRRYLPVLINGDDILFRSNEQHYRIWLEVIKTVGFTLSLGKNYCHEFYLTINSMLFKYKPDDSSFEELPYFNVGLLIAQSKGRLADPTRKLPLLDLYEASVGCSLNRLRAHRRFIHYNLVQIKKMTDDGKYNLFLPLHYGGLGFPAYPEVRSDIKITKFQRRFAAFLSMKVDESLAIGVYPKRYFAALLTDTISREMIIRRAGVKEFKLSLPGPEAGWEEYIPPAGIQLGPFSSAQNLSSSEAKYRHPSRSLLKEFNHYQALLSVGPMTQTLFKFSEQTRAFSDEQLLEHHEFILKYRVPSDTSPPILRRL